jgi:predicted nucleic acid-binding protein
MDKKRVFLDTNVLLKYLRDGTPESLFAPSTLERVTYVINPVVLQELLLASAKHESYSKWQSLTDQFEVTSIDAALFDSEAVKRLFTLRNRAVHSSDFLIMASAATTDCDFLLSYDRDILAADAVTPYSTMTPDDFTAMMEKSA